MKSKQSYMDRALRSSDPRFARILDKMGYGTRHIISEVMNGRMSVNDARAAIGRDPLDHDGDGRKGDSPKPEASDELTEVRAEYQRVLGKRPFHGWSVDELREKIAAADEE